MRTTRMRQKMKKAHPQQLLSLHNANCTSHGLGQQGMEKGFVSIEFLNLFTNFERLAVPIDRTIDHQNAKHRRLTLIHLGCSGIALARNIVRVPAHLEDGVVLAHHSNTALTHLETRITLGRPGSNMIVIDLALTRIKALVCERGHHTIILVSIVTVTVDIRSHCQLRVSTDKVTHLSFPNRDWSPSSANARAMSSPGPSQPYASGGPSP